VQYKKEHPMTAGHQLIAFMIFLQAIYFINRQRKPYFFGLTAKEAIAKSELGKGVLIGLYIFIAVAALGVIAQDFYHLITR
jgi:hypothetical protein